MVRHSDRKEIEHAEYANEHLVKQSHAKEVSLLKEEIEKLKKQVVKLKDKLKLYKDK